MIEFYCESRLPQYEFLMIFFLRFHYFFFIFFSERYLFILIHGQLNMKSRGRLLDRIYWPNIAVRQKNSQSFIFYIASLFLKKENID